MSNETARSSQKDNPKRLAQNWKQAVAIIVLGAILWIPMLCFITFWWDDFSPPQVGVIAIVNLIVGSGLIGFAHRKWIRHLK